MVLKRKLPTQEAKNKKVKEQENQKDDFDMSLSSDEQKVETKAEKGHDFDNEFPSEHEDKPEDFIPDELKSMVADVDTEEKAAEKPKSFLENKESKEEQENQDIAPVSFDEPENDPFAIEEPVISEPQVEEKEEFASPFEKQTDDAPAELPTSQEEPVDSSFASFDEKDSQEPLDFETPEPVNWNEVASEPSEPATDSFETVDWDSKEPKEDNTELKDDRFDSLEDDTPVFGSGNNDGVIPEIEGFDNNFDSPAAVMGEDSKDMAMKPEAKKKLFTGIAAIVVAIGGLFVYSNMDKTTEVTNRWSGAITEANQDIAESEEEQQKLIDEGVDITQAEEVIDLGESSEEDFGLDSTESSETTIKEVDTKADEELIVETSTTEINMLEPEVVETTKSGKEVIKATGEEKMPEDVEESVSLITDLTEEIKKQKEARGDLREEISEEAKAKNKDNALELNRKVDDQLAEYRKLLAEEQDPGKKVKPGAFFSGSYKEQESAQPASSRVAKVELSEDGTAVPAGYAQNSVNPDIKGHQIIEYPQGIAREENEGIRTLDHFRTLLVEKEDERVRIPRNVAPRMRNQGFPKFKVISIIPNYGVIGEYDDKQGVLMVGDTFKGWELVGVYESYAEFKMDTRKHIISLK